MDEFLRRMEAIAGRQDRYIESVVSVFRERLEALLGRVQTRLALDLRERLTILPDGRLDAIPGNLQVLRSLDSRFAELMAEARYPELVQSFVTQFDGQLPFFQETLKVLSDSLKTPLPPVNWSAADLRVFSSLRLSQMKGIEAVVDVVGAKAKQRALLSVGGQPFGKLVETIADELGKTIAEADAIGSTAMPTYYRTVADRGFQIIEADLPELEIRYAYFGPLDKLTRPFCRRLVTATIAGRSWTRAEIEKMQSGAGLPVMTCGGGWRCRHSWAIKPEVKRQEAA